MEEGIEEYKIENGALIEVPCYETHSRGKNWMAVISPDPKSPGGLKRTFMERANGRYYYLIEGLAVGDPVEFGADYYTGGGRRQAKRVYGAVLSVTESALTIRLCATAEDAFEMARHALTPLLEEESEDLSDDRFHEESDKDRAARKLIEAVRAGLYYVIHDDAPGWAIHDHAVPVIREALEEAEATFND